MPQLPLIERAATHGDRIAVLDGGTGHRYHELLHRSHAAASVLLGTQPDLNQARVAFLMPGGLDYIATQWGIWRAGGVAVPLSLSATEKELEYTLTNSQGSMVVTNAEYLPRIAALCKRLALPTITVDSFDDAPTTALPEVAIDRRAMILYTSGTTSQPKGVVTTHGCIQAQIESLVKAWRWQSDDRIPLFLPLHHIHGIINILSCALWSGAEVDARGRFEMETVLRRVAAGAYSVFMAVPTIYVNLIAALESMPAQQREPIVKAFAEMRLMISGSAALPASVHQHWTKLTGQKLLERYGMTEIGMALSNPYDGQRRPGAVGQPLPGVQVRLVSEQGQEIVDEDIAGEIQVRGPNVFLEYWNRPEATVKSFQEGWFRTGDIAVLEQGYYRIMGRSSVDIIKSGGYKLSALEIEAALLDHPAITQCAVVGIPDEKWGEVVAAAVVRTDPTDGDFEQVAAWCKDRISAYKIPRRWLAVDALPRNAMGKIVKPDVARLFD